MTFSTLLITLVALTSNQIPLATFWAILVGSLVGFVLGGLVVTAIFKRLYP